MEILLTDVDDFQRELDDDTEASCCICEVRCCRCFGEHLVEFCLEEKTRLDRLEGIQKE